MVDAETAEDADATMVVADSEDSAEETAAAYGSYL